MSGLITPKFSIGEEVYVTCGGQRFVAVIRDVWWREKVRTTTYGVIDTFIYQMVGSFELHVEKCLSKKQDPDDPKLEEEFQAFLKKLPISPPRKEKA